MRSTSRAHLWLLLVAGTLLGLVLWTLKQQAPAAPDSLLPLSPDAVTQIDIRIRNNPIRRFEKHAGHWWMLAPQQGRADDAHLERLAKIVAANALRWRPASDFDAARIGLDPPYAVLHLNGYELRLGGLAALAPQRYVAVDTHVALIPARYAADIAATPDSELAHSGSTLQTL